MKSILSNLVNLIKYRLQTIVEPLFYSGKERFCPVCGKSSSRFGSYGVVPRKDVRCVHCGALERHRFLWLFLNKKTDLFDDKQKKMLHVAPEKCFESIFKQRLGSGYLTADLFNPRVMVRMDICNIQYPDESFDVISCSHVLEHVLDDKQAMKELFRVLKNNGWAILNVPITSGKTFEDSSIVDPKDRLKAFGQEDHVRSYGTDYVDRLRDSGFTVEITKVSDLANSDEVVRMGLTQAVGEIYFCKKFCTY